MLENSFEVERGTVAEEPMECMKKYKTNTPTKPKYAFKSIEYFFGPSIEVPTQVTAEEK